MVLVTLFVLIVHAGPVLLRGTPAWRRVAAECEPPLALQVQGFGGTAAARLHQDRHRYCGMLP